jgi:hypothetical protein
MILSPPRRTGGHEEYREIFWERIGRGIAGVRVTTKAERR